MSLPHKMKANTVIPLIKSFTGLPHLPCPPDSTGYYSMRSAIHGG